MDLENLIKDTFADHEHDAPDSAPVLAGARRRIHRTRLLPSRPLLAAAGVAVLAVTAVTVVALNRPATVKAAAPAQHSAPAAAAKPTIAVLKMPFSLGWLPPGEASYSARRINRSSSGTGSPSEKPNYGGEYLLDVKNGSQTLLVDVQEMRAAQPNEAMFKSGPGRPVTVDGRSGMESPTAGGLGGYELYLSSPRGGSLYVNVAPEPGSTASAQQLIDAGRRIAQHVEFPGSTTLTPSFGLRDLPADTEICAFDIGEGGSTDYLLGACATTMPTLEVKTGEAPQPGSVPGNTVQGHKTRYLKDNNFGMLWVLDAVHGTPVVITGYLSEAELYKLADHLVLPD